MNRGLSDDLKSTFPSIKPVLRPIVVDQEIKNPNWLVGFTSDEGCFLINIFKSKTKIEETIKLIFQLTQQFKDEQLIKSLIEFFKAGNVYKSYFVIDFRITKF